MFFQWMQPENGASRDSIFTGVGRRGIFYTPPAGETGFSRRASDTLASPTMNESMQAAARQGASLYQPEHEHDACGAGFIADSRRRPLEPRPALRHAVALQPRPPRRARCRLQDRRRRGPADAASVQPAAQRRSAGCGHHLYQDSDLGVGFCLPAPRQRLCAGARQGDHGGGAGITRPVPVRLARGAHEHQRARRQGATHHAAHRTGARRQALGHELPTSTSGNCSSRATRSKSAPPPTRSRISTSPRCRAGSSSTRGCWCPRRWKSFTATCRTRTYETALCIYHQRYSTNTFPTWPLGQPFRMLGHNGEINTVQAATATGCAPARPSFRRILG